MYVLLSRTISILYCQNKDLKVEVMVCAAVTRARFDAQSVCTFDDKIGMFPFVERVAAQHATMNNPCRKHAGSPPNNPR
jgi:hypothetical protein